MVDAPLGQRQRALLPIAVRYSYTLVPLGFGIWLAHMAFIFSLASTRSFGYPERGGEFRMGSAGIAAMGSGGVFRRTWSMRLNSVCWAWDWWDRLARELSPGKYGTPWAPIWNLRSWAGVSLVLWIAAVCG